MADRQPAAPMSAEVLERGLRSLAGELAVPAPSSSFAGAVRARVEARRERRWGWLDDTILGAGGVGRPVRRSMLAAVALLLVAAAVAVAVGLGVPGIRILFGDPGATPRVSGTASLPAVTSPPGMGLGAGSAVSLDVAASIVGFEPRLPAELGSPGGVFVGDRRLTLAWTAGPGLPPLRTAPSLGLVLTQFRGDVDEGWYEKVVFDSATTVDAVRVGGGAGFWITGEPHRLVYRDAGGAFLEETRRVVGDVLIWSDGDLTYRLESSLGQEATVRLAESIE
jgi:hypothetical protein